jgi:hypothetical protein
MTPRKGVATGTDAGGLSAAFTIRHLNNQLVIGSVKFDLLAPTTQVLK